MHPRKIYAFCWFPTGFYLSFQHGEKLWDCFPQDPWDSDTSPSNPGGFHRVYLYQDLHGSIWGRASWPERFGVILHPGRLTWNLQSTHLERKMIFQTSMIMVHVNLPGCMCFLLFSWGGGWRRWRGHSSVMIVMIFVMNLTIMIRWFSLVKSNRKLMKTDISSAFVPINLYDDNTK